MQYDHHRKAGNQGDVVKHPALIAALDVIIKQTALHDDAAKGSFHYMDLFAGHAWHPLLDEGNVTGVQKRFEWPDGIGTLHDRLWSGQTLDPAVQTWRDWYVPKRELVRGWYPGSSIIAADMCRKYQKSIRMTLFDISEVVRDDLRRFQCPVCPTEITSNDSSEIGNSLDATGIEAVEIRDADFVLIDPPGWRSANSPTFPNWSDYCEYILGNRVDRPTLMWMPTTALDFYDKEKRKPTLWREGDAPQKLRDSTDKEFSWTAVRWRIGQSSACVLVYNCAHQEIKNAVECICDLASWSFKHSR